MRTHAAAIAYSMTAGDCEAEGKKFVSDRVDAAAAAVALGDKKQKFDAVDVTMKASASAIKSCTIHPFGNVECWSTDSGLTVQALSVLLSTGVH